MSSLFRLLQQKGPKAGQIVFSAASSPPPA
jgi:hypothetical protein